MVYEDLRQQLLEDLYRHSVEQARLGPALEQLDDALGTLCEATPKELHAGVLSLLVMDNGLPVYLKLYYSGT